MESIISATISALATIIAAWISNRESKSVASTSSPSRSEAPSQSRYKRKEANQERIHFSFTTNTLWWTAVIGAFSLLLIYAGFFIHWDLPSMMGLFGIPLIVVMLGVTKPTSPWTAAALTYGVCTISFITEFFVKMSWGRSIQLSSNDKWLPLWMFLIASAYAFIAYSVCWWRRK